MLKARAAARWMELGRAMLALALTGARAAGASGLYAEECTAGPAQGCSSPSTHGCCATHSSQLRLHWPSSNSVGARPGRRQGHLLREERWRDVWGGLGGSPYRYWRFSILCEAGVGADGRFKSYELAGRLLLALSRGAGTREPARRLWRGRRTAAKFLRETPTTVAARPTCPRCSSGDPQRRHERRPTDSQSPPSQGARRRCSRCECRQARGDATAMSDSVREQSRVSSPNQGRFIIAVH